MKGKYHFRAILFASFAILLSFQGTAQQSAFFTPTTSQNISTSRQQYVSRLADDPATKDMRYVRFADLPEQLTPDGGLFLNLSGESRNLEFRPVHYELKANGDYTWYGKNRRTNTHVALIKMRDRLAGFVQSDSGFWEIVPLKKDVSIIREMDISMFQNERCGVDNILADTPLSSERISTVDLCSQSGCTGTIDILVLVPRDVTAWYGTTFEDPWGPFIHMVVSLSSLQMALINSGVGDINFRFEIESFDFTYTMPLNVTTDIDNLSNTAAAIRNESRADLVVMLTSMDYPGIRGTSLSGEENDEDEFEFKAPGEPFAFAIVEVENNLNPTWTFAHEVAHLFGARHNRSDNVLACDNCGDDEDICTHGFRFDNGGMDRTIMSLLLDNTILTGSQRALHFSNPDVQFNGFATGTEDDDNIRSIRNAACVVRNYRPPHQMDVTISGEHLWCPLSNEGFPYSYSANVNEPLPGFPGVPPYAYEWRFNTDGNFTDANPGLLLGTGTSLNFNSVPECPQFFLRLNVTSSDGITLSTTRVISTSSCDECSPDFLRISQGDSSNSNKYDNPIIGDDQTIYLSNFGDNYRIFPNPFSSKLQIERHTNENIPYEVTIFDISGKVVYQMVNKNKNVLNIDLNEYPDGIFTVQIINDYEMVTHKIIKVQK